MRIFFVLFTLTLFTGACSTSKKPAPKRSTSTISRADILRGGTSFNNPVIILLQTERQVLDEEYRWLTVNYPGYALIRKSHTIRSSKHFDIVRIKTGQQQVKDIYFDCTAYWASVKR